ncbi:reverse transcriptase [Gossypium australe]|uniref:Reverse transcriptase n=1 Tax=Gossypium australe TaxID=47621 RepID=A0A5B6VAT8_9ROSI|nr:reverse transcriptase [Gossypium australe]
MYWWPGMKWDISKLVSKCLICQAVKAEHQPITIPEWKWERFTMDFVSGLPLSPKKKDAIWVIIDRLKKSAHFIPIHWLNYIFLRLSYYMKCRSLLFETEILDLRPDSGINCKKLWVHSYISALHSILRLMDNPNVLYRFWKICFSVYILEFEGNWEKYLPLFEFVYNNSYQSSIKRVTYEPLYGRKYRTPLYWIELNEKKIHGVDLVREKVIRDSLKACSDRQKSYANLKRKELEIQVGDKVFLKVSFWKKVLRFGRKGKLSPQFIGPYEITKRIGPVAYRLALPPDLDKIHNVFHVSMLRRYQSDPSHVIFPTEVEIQPGMTYSEEPIKILAHETKELRNKNLAVVKVLWQRHGIEKATWEPEETMRKQYPNFFTCKIFEDENSLRGSVVTTHFQ